MMNKTLKMAELISSDIRSRSNADKIRAAIDNQYSNVIIDFTDVEFISRSFADELWVIIDEMDTVKFSIVNQAKVVETMLNVVASARQKIRVHKSEKADILTLKSMEDFDRVFATI